VIAPHGRRQRPRPHATVSAPLHRRVARQQNALRFAPQTQGGHPHGGRAQRPFSQRPSSPRRRTATRNSRSCCCKPKPTQTSRAWRDTRRCAVWRWRFC
jgi:hypothetical protein